MISTPGGSIDVGSEPGRGATFNLYFPRIAAAIERDVLSPAGSDEGSETILLAEDDAGVRTLADRLLRERGYTVLVATDGRMALSLAEKYKGTIHLLVTDVVMPHISGREMADRLRRLRPELRVLYISGHTDDAVLRHGILGPEIIPRHRLTLGHRRPGAPFRELVAKRTRHAQYFEVDTRGSRGRSSAGRAHPWHG